MNVCVNTEVSQTNLISDLAGYPETIWYDPKGIDNIISIDLAEKHFPIKYGEEKCFIVLKGGKVSSVS